jgi:hypothetical protein
MGNNDNNKRINLIHLISEEISRRKWNTTVLLFPGGYFYLNHHIGHKKYDDRLHSLLIEPFSGNRSPPPVDRAAPRGRGDARLATFCPG